VRDAWAIAAKDGREIWRDGRFRWAAVVLAGLLVVATVSGWAQTRATAQLHEEARTAERALSLDKGDMNPHAAAHYGAFVFKPVEPLAALDPGLTPFVGVTLFLEAHQQHLARHRPVADQTPAGRLGELTVAGALQALVPLLIVSLCYAAFAGERERGTLKLLSSLGVSRRALIAGKVFGCVLPIVVVLVPAGSVAAFVLLPATSAGVDRDGAWRMMALAALYAAYFAWWTIVALTVSARARSSSSALVSLLAMWFVACLLAPPLASAVARWWHPSPTSAEFALAIQQAHDALPAWTDRVAQVEERFLSGALPITPDLPSNPEVVALVDAERDESLLYERLFADLHERYAKQSAVYERIGWLMPSLAIRGLSMRLAGTDYAFHRRFLDAASAYRAQFLALLNAELVAYTEANTFDYTRGRELWERIPEFAFEAPDLATSVDGASGSMAALALWIAAAGLALAAAVSRMAVS
jgi:ABC-2 type transport system permease protein